MTLRITRPWILPGSMVIPQEILQVVDGSALAGALLIRRGIRTAREAVSFIDPAAYVPADPFDFPGMKTAVERIVRAIEVREPICIWGDFDVDGQTSTAILVSALRVLGAEVRHHIPVRETESHGVRWEFLEREIKLGARLILTCDTGIAAGEVLDRAFAQGVDVIITDHHELPTALPQKSVAIINPHLLPADHPCASLPGAGVALVFAQALAVHFEQPSLVDDLLELCALGIVADVASQRLDTRWLLQRGLARLRQTRRQGLLALCAKAGVRITEIDETSIGFQLAPRMNAVGRLDNANQMVDLLTTPDPTFAAEIVDTLETHNINRKEMSDQITTAALALLAREPDLLLTNVLVLHGTLWHPGVVGIVASRLVERFNRPVILLAGTEGLLRGSARSIPGVDITRALQGVSALLQGFGGHAMAAGMALKKELLAEFRAALHYEVEKQVGDTELANPLVIDAVLPLRDLRAEVLRPVEKLAPFGNGNPAPVFLCSGLVITSVTPFGLTREHLKIKVMDPAGTQTEILWWGGAGSPLPSREFDLAYTARTKTAREDGIQVEWLEWRDAETVKIASVTAADKVRILDLRDMRTEPIEILAQSFPRGAVLFANGSEAGLPLIVPPFTPATDLVLYTLPPSLPALRDLLAAVRPERILLIGKEAPSQNLESLINRAGSALSPGKAWKETSLEHLSARLNITPLLMQTLLAWFEARGFLETASARARILRYRRGQGTAAGNFTELTRAIKRLSGEMTAFQHQITPQELRQLIAEI